MCDCFFQLFLSPLSVLSKARTNNLRTPWKEASRGNLVRLLFSKFLDYIFVWYSFKQTGLLNHSSNSFISFTLSLLNKVTIGTYNLVFVILNVVSAIVDIIQSFVQFNSRWIFQLINGIFKDLKKLLKYFSGTAMFTSLNTPLSASLKGLKKLDLYLKLPVLN